MKRSTSRILIALSALILTACGGGGGETAPPSVTLTSISLTPASPSVALNAVLHLTVTGHYSDGTTQTIYSPVSWRSSSCSLSGLAVRMRSATSARSRSAPTSAPPTSRATGRPSSAIMR